jgi:hypothetical protein
MNNLSIGDLVMFNASSWYDYNLDEFVTDKSTSREFIGESGTIKEISGDFAKIEYFDGFVLSLPIKYLTKGDWFK